MTAYAAGRLAWADGMLLEDYLDAVDFLEAGGAVPRDRWVEEFRQAAAAASFEGLL